MANQDWRHRPVKSAPEPPTHAACVAEAASVADRAAAKGAPVAALPGFTLEETGRFFWWMSYLDSTAFTGMVEQWSDVLTDGPIIKARLELEAARDGEGD